MRKFNVCIHNTFIAGDLCIGDPKAAYRRGVATVELHDAAIIKALSAVPDGSTLVVVGNMFGPKVDKASAEKIVGAITSGNKKLICLEGGPDSKLLRELSKAGKLDDGGDISILCSGDSGAVISFYPMVWWPKKESEYLNVFGYSGTKEKVSGSIGCNVEALMSKTRKPLVSLQYLLESSKKGGPLWV